jgi:hypothetical protein
MGFFTGKCKMAHHLLRILFNVAKVFMISLPVVAAEAPKRVQDVAKSIEWKAGSPKYSDVAMRSILVLDGETQLETDQNGWIIAPDAPQAAEDFHVSEIAWSYVSPTDRTSTTSTKGYDFINSFTQKNIAFSLTNLLTVKPESGYGVETIDHGWATKDDGSLYGCRNKVIFQNVAFGYARNQINTMPDSINTIRFQQDGTNGQYDTAARSDRKGCFCSSCVVKFATRCSGEYYNSPSSGPFRVSTDVLTGLNLSNANDLIAFKQFARDTDTLYISSLTYRIRNYAESRGKTVLFSCNSAAYAVSHSPNLAKNSAYLLYDYWISEVSGPNHTQNWFWTLKDTSITHKKKFLTTSQNLFTTSDFRRFIAGSYAVGINYMVPWDMYIEDPPTGRRLYSAKTDFADLYGFIRGISGYLDGYEDAFGNGDTATNAIEDSRLTGDYVGTPPAKVTTGSNMVICVHPRQARGHDGPRGGPPGGMGGDTPALHHLVKISRLFPDKQLTVKLLTPKLYNEAEHMPPKPPPPRITDRW